MPSNSKKLTVTAVTHPHSGIITAFINQLPGLVVQGSDDADVQKKLDAILTSYVNYVQRLKSLDFEIKNQAFA
jgi:hypothetical protein